MKIGQKQNRRIEPAGGPLLQALENRINRNSIELKRARRPFVTVSYAQSVDGSIAAKKRQPLRLSGQASMVLTHRLRALSDAILIGIETALADNPRLTVRLVEGRNPQPVILDTRIRLPVDSNLARRQDLQSWVIAGRSAAGPDSDMPGRNGAIVLPCLVGGDGLIDLAALMPLLYARGIRSVMVEGGARVITSFVNARLVDQFVITVAPMLVGGLPVFDGTGLASGRPYRLDDVTYLQLEKDLVIWARPIWEDG